MIVTPASVSRAQRGMKRSGMLRCRSGIVANAEREANLDQRCTAALRYALHRIRETLHWFPVAALVALWFAPHAGLAQSQAKPKPGAAAGIGQNPAKPAQAPNNAANTAAAPAAAAPELDLAYGAYQRGYFFTAFGFATRRVENFSDPKAMTLLGELYANGLGVAPDDRRAAEWYKLAAARGDSNAMFGLAMFALQGRAGPRDREQSAKWLAAAAKLGHPQAAYDLALLYIEGQLFPQDFKRATELLRTAADAGSADAQYALGTFYKEGRGVGKDMREADRLWAAASLADNTDAEVEYGIALYNGDGVPRNEDAAAVLFRKAARHGSAIAQDRLARILASGAGAPANAAEAVKWHLISRAGGETDIALDDFVAKLDASTRQAGEAAAKPWLDALQAAREARERAAQGAPAQPQTLLPAPPPQAAPAKP